MPSWVNTAEEKKAWSKAKAVVREQRSKSEDEFSDKDWGLVTQITKNILKSSVLSGSTDSSLVYRLSKVEHMLSARKSKASADDKLPDGPKQVLSALKRVMSFGGQAIAKLRKGEISAEGGEAAGLASALSDVADRLESLVNGPE